MQLTKKKGFTLIEIVIVLAIAALILVIVFLAVTGAQRSRRNDGRKNIAAQALAALSTYQSNNNGANPPNEVASSELQDIVTNRNVPGLGALTIDVAGVAPACTNAGTTVITVIPGAASANACLEGNGTTVYTITQ